MTCSCGNPAAFFFRAGCYSFIIGVPNSGREVWSYYAKCQTCYNVGGYNRDLLLREDFPSWEALIIHQIMES